MKQKIYQSLFWVGYVLVIVAAFIPFKKDLHEITFNIVTFKFHFDQVLHAIVYFLICLYFLAGHFLGLALFKENSFRKLILAVFLLATLTEGVQLFIPYRAFNFFDWLSNVVGICIGLVIIRLTSESREIVKSE
jgi:VanZ family protein